MAFNRYSLDLERSSSQYVSITDASQSGLDLSGDLTLEGLFKFEQKPSTAGDNFHLMSKSDAGTDRCYAFEIDSVDKLLFIASDDGTFDTGHHIYDRSTSALGITVGKWHHIAVTFDISTETTIFYLDSVVVGTTAGDASSIGASLNNSSAPFGIGARKSGGTPDNYFDGKINNIRVFSDVRTPTEIEDNMYIMLSGTSNNLVSSWYNSENDHNDNSGSNNLTASGSPVFSTNVPFTGANTTDWSTPLEIQSDNTKVSGSSDHTDIPLLIADGNLSNVVYAGLETDGKDLRITTDEAGTTEIPFEIVDIDTTAKTCEIWLKMPTLQYDADDSIYIWYGNSSALAYDADAPFGSEYVWDSNYMAVYHMGQSSGTLIDSTSNAKNETFNGDLPDSQSGKIGNAQDFDGTGDYIGALTSTRLTTNMTFQAWILYDTAIGAGKQFYPSSDWGGTDKNWLLNITDGNLINGVIGDGGSNQDATLISSTTLTTDTQYFIALKHTGTAQKIWLNDAVEDSQTGSYSGGASTNNRYIGGDSALTAGALWNGLIDEVRFSNIERGDDWLATEYNNQNAPETFWTPVSSRRIFVVS